MPIHYTRPDGYARRPRAPRRRREPVARHDLTPGQGSFAELDRAEQRARAQTKPCPACHAPTGQPCTRRPTIGEGKDRQPLAYMCHAERHALVDVDDEQAC